MAWDYLATLSLSLSRVALNEVLTKKYGLCQVIRLVTVNYLNSFGLNLRRVFNK